MNSGKVTEWVESLVVWNLKVQKSRVSFLLRMNIGRPPTNNTEQWQRNEAVLCTVTKKIKMYNW